MAYSKQTYQGDAVTTDFNITFSYLDQSHIVVAVDKVRTTEVGSNYTFTWNNATNIRVTHLGTGLAVESGLDIAISRETPINDPAVVFGGGASLSSANLNKNSQYLTFALQEATDANQEFTKLYLGSFSVAPLTDNEGDPLQTGAVYYDAVSLALFYWTGSVWIIGESTLAAGVFKEAAALSAEQAANSAAAAEAFRVLAEADAAQTASDRAVTTANAATVEALYDLFDDRFLGPKAGDPPTDNDGDPLVTGATYSNTTRSIMRIFNGIEWVDFGDSISLALLKANNLSDLENVAAARVNLGLTSTATTETDNDPVLENNPTRIATREAIAEYVGDQLESSGLSVLHVQEQYALGTPAPAHVAGATVARALNTQVYNGITGASLNSGGHQVTLPVGTYKVSGSCSVRKTNASKTFLYNVTEGRIDLEGMNVISPAGALNSIQAPLAGILTVTTPSVFEMRFFGSAGISENGQPSSAGGVEVYSDLLFSKVA